MPTPTIILNSNTHNNYFAMLSSEGDDDEDNENITIKLFNKATTPRAKLPMKDNNRPQEVTTKISPIMINTSALCGRTAIINTRCTYKNQA